MILYPFRCLWWLLSSIRRSFGKPPDFVIFVLESSLPTLPDPPRPLWQRFTSRPGLSVKELGERFEAIARDSRIKGVVLHLRSVPMPLATLQDLRELITRLRQSGKRVVAWAPSYTTASYYLACACDEILMMPVGVVQELGLASTGIFLADGLARFGIKADFVQVSPYKSAADVLTRSKMSGELREQVTWLLDSQLRQFLDAIAESRGLDVDAARDLVDGAPYTDDVALESHVVDHVVGEEQLSAHLGGEGGASPVIGTWERARSRLRPPAPRLNRGKYVALLRIEGTILDGRSGRLPVNPPVDIPLIGDERAGDLTVVQAVRQVAGDKRAGAVVLFVNSRGGSVTASEAMRQALEVLAARKPLVVAMGAVAASGGYWVSSPARWLIARPGTITGSIGVLTGKIVTAGLFSKLHVNRETIAFGEHATIGEDSRPYTDEERRIVKGQIDRIYGVFLELVGKARGMTVEEVDPIAGGRVWTGRQALERKLIDELGGLEAAISKARSLGGLREDAPVREARGARRPVPPAIAGAAGFVAYVLEGASLITRAPALALMDYLPGDLT